ncbi:unnamed protein product [Pleuronectes platessa]|uniref:Uncharacterized protein n=1 Tax=Pleuronectes platessa TaxID=8262 RepID=A0A9N7VA54_PLEPL|nr:unnamed protein product [Pleuronectes platessa]
MQMGQAGDRTADLQVGGRPLYPSATADPVQWYSWRGGGLVGRNLDYGQKSHRCPWTAPTNAGDTKVNESARVAATFGTDICSSDRENSFLAEAGGHMAGSCFDNKMSCHLSGPPASGDRFCKLQSRSPRRGNCLGDTWHEPGALIVRHAGRYRASVAEIGAEIGGEVVECWKNNTTLRVTLSCAHTERATQPVSTAPTPIFVLISMEITPQGESIVLAEKETTAGIANGSSSLIVWLESEQEPGRRGPHGVRVHNFKRTHGAALSGGQYGRCY